MVRRLKVLNTPEGRRRRSGRALGARVDRDRRSAHAGAVSAAVCAGSLDRSTARSGLRGARPERCRCSSRLQPRLGVAARSRGGSGRASWLATACSPRRSADCSRCCLRCWLERSRRGGSRSPPPRSWSPRGRASPGSAPAMASAVGLDSTEAEFPPILDPARPRASPLPMSRVDDELTKALEESETIAKAEPAYSVSVESPTRKRKGIAACSRRCW